MTLQITQKYQIKNYGFTLIELLVVVSVISLLSSLVLAAVRDARVKARDARRISDIKQISTALELFYNEHGHYPPEDKTGKLQHSVSYDTACTTVPGCGHCDRWCIFDGELSSIDLPNDLILVSGQLYYSYTSSSGDDFQSYGLAAFLEMDNLAAQTDGGYYDNAFELGQRPSYCMNKYTGDDRDWLWRHGGQWDWVCDGGN